MTDIDPWRDPTYYENGPVTVCLGCGCACRETHWGKWCFECNVERIKRITKTLQDLAVPVSRAPVSGDPASVGALGQTILDEDYESLDSIGIAEAILKYWDVRWK